MTAQNPNQTNTDPLSKPINQLTRADVIYAGKYVLSELAIHLVFYGIMFALCTTIGAMIWVGLWCAVLLIPIGAVAWHYFKKSKKNLNP